MAVLQTAHHVAVVGRADGAAVLHHAEAVADAGAVVARGGRVVVARVLVGAADHAGALAGGAVGGVRRRGGRAGGAGATLRGGLGPDAVCARLAGGGAGPLAGAIGVRRSHEKLHVSNSRRGATSSPVGDSEVSKPYVSRRDGIKHEIGCRV